MMTTANMNRVELNNEELNNVNGADIFDFLTEWGPFNKKNMDKIINKPEPTYDPMNTPNIPPWEC